MARAYSMDLRKRVVAARDAGQKTAEVAQRFGVSPAWVRRLLQRRRQTGNIAARQGKPGRKPKLAANQSWPPIVGIWENWSGGIPMRR